jgi:isoamylase
MHVKGFTQLHPAVEARQRGTFGGLGKEVIAYIKSLGVTSVELLPIHTFINDSHLTAWSSHCPNVPEATHGR